MIGADIGRRIKPMADRTPIQKIVSDTQVHFLRIEIAVLGPDVSSGIPGQVGEGSIVTVFAFIPSHIPILVILIPVVGIVNLIHGGF